MRSILTDNRVQTYFSGSKLFQNHFHFLSRLVGMTKALALLLLFTASSYASIIDLTPGGFNFKNQPQIVQDFWKTQAYHTQFPVAFGDSTGWQLLGPIALTSTPFEQTTLSISWDMANSGGFSVAYLFVSSLNLQQNFYQITGSERFLSKFLFEIEGLSNIRTCAIYGPRNSAPDSGSTVTLLGLGLFTVTILKRYSSAFKTS